MLRIYRTKIKIIVFLLSLLPLATMCVDVIQNTLGPDPAEALADRSGEWALIFLLLTLAITPLRRVTANTQWVHYRRMVGLFAFFYAVIHLLVYLLFLLALRWQELWTDILERPYITVGFTAFLLLLPLAITSTYGWQRRLGRRWKQLHKLVYIAAILALTHLWWQMRSDVGEALWYTLLFGSLMLLRIRLKRIRALTGQT